MKMNALLRAGFLALALGAAGCSQGSQIASPGATNPGTGGGGGGGSGGGGTGGGTATCPTGTSNQGALGSKTICQLSGEILANLSLPATTDVVYRLNGRVDIGKDTGADGTAAGGTAVTLTISPGATLYGTVAGDMLIVNRGSRIVANGTVSQPIVFTSDKDILGQNDPTISNRQWGGVIILGKAPIRGCNTAVTSGTVACQDEVEGVTNATGRVALFGGATASDNSGSLQYVQIRYPGAFLTSAAAGDDLNGLTLGGVGSGTLIDNLQIHNSGDDGVEVFGGTVNLKHLVVTGALDDSLDCDYGWTGNVQFLVVKQVAMAGGPDGLMECSNAIKASSNGTTLQTKPTISNFTFVGLPTSATGSALKGIGIDAAAGAPGATAVMVNGVVTGATRCVSIVDPETGSGRGSADTTNPPVFNSILFDCVNQPTTVAAARINAGTNNTTTTPNTLASTVFPGTNETARTAVNPTTLGAFFTAANYIGAFSPTETPASNWAAGWTIQLLPPAGCPSGTTEASSTLNGRKRCVLAGTLGQGGVPASVRLTAGNYYELSGRVDVGVDTGAAGTGGVAGALTIDPGVTIFGKNAGDMLIINRGSQVLVNGTTSAPVIMTSLADVTRTTVNPSANREWGGFIVLGRAPIRGCNTAVASGTAACQDEVEGVTNATGRVALFGGATANDTSGRINNLQIRYAGAFLTSAAAGDDLNGLTLAGVGSNTTIDSVQVHNSGDDGIEIFGGTVNMKRVIITGALDDSLDCDYGWTGNVQFMIVRQSALAGGPDGLMECSNAAKSSTGGTIQTRPTISNFTMIGVPTSSTGSALKGIGIDASAGSPGASARMVNGVVIGSTRCLSVAQPETGSGRGEADATNPPVFNSTLFDCLQQPSTTAIAGSTVSASSIIAAGTNNSTTTANTLGLAASPATSLANFVNGSTETARTAVDPTTLGSFFSAAPYIGAVRNTSDNWWRGWSCGLEAVTC